jgi:hypothetical protein
MMSLPRFLGGLAALVLTGLVFQPSARAEDSAANGNQSKIESRAIIRQALTKKINWEFIERPLGDIIEDLKKELNIPMRLDMKPLGDIGITLETPISFKMSGITAKSALNLMLRDLGLVTTIHDEVLMVTTPEEAENRLETVVYDVSDLPAFRRESGGTEPDYEQLIDVIMKNILPTSWDDLGGPGSVMGYSAGDVQSLVISQTEEAQDRIADLLSNLRKLRQWPLSVEEINKLPVVPPPKPKETKPRPKPMGGMGGGAGGMGGMGGMGGGMGGMGGGMMGGAK